ncbi:hypothetical protein OsJ_20419 [Oryza sativa Japonica Group]|uniref:Glycosyltransferase n=1 Tax=Oryza sativa subsp. japonica TaxID=39947 RepID=B9FRY5_ORYSJ|nr:hypothetical protein OsJ_20419 [Oryza sativa Japonica Group]
MAHVAVVTFPFSSHAAVLLSFARALAAASPASTFSFLSTAASFAHLRKTAAAGDLLPGNMRFVEVADGAPPPDAPPPRRMAVFMEAAEAGGVVEAGLEAARPAAGGFPVSCRAASRADELLTSHPGLESYRIRDIPDGVVSGDLNYVINLLLNRMAQRLPRAATAVALNTFPGLDPPTVTAALTAVLPTCLPLGPYHLLATAPANDDDPNGCLAWLDRHAPRTVAYVSFGTVASPRPDELRELAAGLEASGAPFLWSLREDSWPLLPPGFLERTKQHAAAGLVVPWAPQVGVLRHASVGAFVTHAGWASVMEGASSGVPMACRPFFGDQRTNARSVSHVWGFGTAFDGAMTRGGVATAVASLVGGEDGRRMRARAQELQAKVASAFVEPDGSCRKNFAKFVEIICAS